MSTSNLSHESFFINLTDKEFKRLQAFIENQLGIRMPEQKRVMLQSRLQKRLRHFGYKSFNEYLDSAFSDNEKAGELLTMINIITTNKTDFFREPDHFDTMNKIVLPDLLSRHNTLSIWSSAASTGEEPYTIAVVCEEYMRNNNVFNYSVLGTDINTEVLEIASLGIYHSERVKPVSRDVLERNFLKSKNKAIDQVRVKPQIRQKMIFQRLNLMDERFPLKGDFHIIFCRNVLIYFDKPTQEQVIRKLLSHLAPDGYLFIGHSETLTGLSFPIRQVGSAVYKKK